MLLNSGAGEDSWESLGVQGDQASQYLSKSTLNIHWEDWCWGWNSNTLATWCEELTHWKRPWCWGDWRQEKAAAEDEMVRYHHLLNGHEFEQTSGDGEGLEAWCAVIQGVTKSWTQLNEWIATTMPRGSSWVSAQACRLCPLPCLVTEPNTCGSHPRAPSPATQPPSPQPTPPWPHLEAPMTNCLRRKGFGLGIYCSVGS